jgi:parallel beta-helix repeat protein
MLYDRRVKGLKRIVSAFMVTVILVGTFIMAFDIRPVRASGTIYIRADGSIDPPTANITSNDGVTYTFTDNNIIDSIVVERDNIVIDGAGYRLQGTDVLESRGIDLTGRTNVTVQNTQIRSFYYGIWLSSSSNNTISRNHLEEIYRFGIQLEWSSSFNIMSANHIVNSEAGIALLMSNYNSVTGNNITANIEWGIYLSYCVNNNVIGNVIADNGCGIWFGGSSGNVVFRNSFLDNHGQAYSLFVELNSWDDGYPGGGNYWSNYWDADVYKGLHQNETGSDGVWDHLYYPLLDEVNQDRYPLTKSFSLFPLGDVDGDRDVDIFDIVRMASCYGVIYPDERYDRLCDMDLDGDIDIFDIVKAAGNYGESW